VEERVAVAGKVVRVVAVAGKVMRVEAVLVAATST
jgi:hypothetical protein